MLCEPLLDVTHTLWIGKSVSIVTLSCGGLARCGHGGAVRDIYKPDPSNEKRSLLWVILNQVCLMFKHTWVPMLAESANRQIVAVCHHLHPVLSVYCMPVEMTKISTLKTEKIFMWALVYTEVDGWWVILPQSILRSQESKKQYLTNWSVSNLTWKMYVCGGTKAISLWWLRFPVV